MLDNVQLIHMQGRVYDPALGRFLSPDPLLGDLQRPQSLNAYSYVSNNPLSRVDPTGLVDEIPAMSVVEVTGSRIFDRGSRWTGRGEDAG